MSDHTHTPGEVGAAFERHDHDVIDVMNAAKEHHSHTVHDLPQTPTMQEFGRLADRIADLELQYEKLQERLEDDREAIAAAIERRAKDMLPASEDLVLMAALSRDPDMLLGLEFIKLAQEIRKDMP